MFKLTVRTPVPWLNPAAAAIPDIVASPSQAITITIAFIIVIVIVGVIASEQDGVACLVVSHGKWNITKST